jgi:DNA-binding CsgD family transcriptional regulator
VLHRASEIGSHAVYRRLVPLATGVALLEREREVGALREGLDRACSGEGTLLLVQGPAGVGKTELVREARAAAARARMTVLEARASELERPFAFGVVRQLLEPVIGQRSEQDDLFAGAAGPATRLFQTGDRGSSGSDGGFEALHSLYWLIVNLADRAPLLVSVDDCQWADHDSLRFLAYLGQRIEGLQIAMLLVARPPDALLAEAESVLAELSSRPEAVALYPQPLSEEAAMTFARERLGADAEDEFCRTCHAATGGNPLFLRELLRALDSAAVAPSASAASEVQAVGPAAVARFVLHRLSKLGDGASELARAVAVLGDGSEPQLAARVSGLTVPVARDAADALVRADIFARTERLGFVHPIVRAALYEDLAPGERQARHAAAADALARVGADPERIAAHLVLTGPNGDARTVQTLRSAAAAAARRGAPLAAAARLIRALDESPAEEERAEILAELGDHEVAAMQFDAAEQHLRAVLDSDAPLQTRADAASTLARCAVASGSRSAESTVDALASLAHALAPTDSERSLELGADMLMVVAIMPQLRAGVWEHMERFRDQARGHPGFEAVARIYTALEQQIRGEYAQAVAEEVQAAIAAGLPPSAATNAGFLAVHALRTAERYELPLRLLDLAMEGARREGHAARQGLIHGQRAAIALARGSLHDAQVEAETGLRLIGESHFALLQLLSVAIVVHIERGEPDAASELVARGDALGVGEDRLYLDQYLLARGRLRAARGELYDAASDLRWSGQRLDAAGVVWPSEWKAYAAPMLAALGKREQAHELARSQLATARRVGSPGALGMSLRAAAKVAGDDERLGLLEDAVSILDLGSARLELAHALGDLGAELRRSGRRREGRETERRAMELAGECGAIALARAARAELQAGPGRRARLELTGPNALTAAERRVCLQASEGHSNREIAQTLFVTEKTVERHLSSAYHKLGIRSRFQLAEAIEPR